MVVVVSEKPVSGISRMNAEGKSTSKLENSLTAVFAIALIILLLPVWLPLILVVLGIFLVHRVLVYILIWLLWLPRGKDVLFVYSESPIWKEYMLGEVLPLVDKRAVILNWSERARWQRWSLGVQVFHALAGDREFNPLVMVFRPFHLARKYRFWRAFKAWKHGDKEPIAKLRQELMLVL